jgi:hypothetical protein
MRVQYLGLSRIGVTPASHTGALRSVAPTRPSNLPEQTCEESGAHASLLADGAGQRLYVRVAGLHGEPAGPAEIHDLRKGLERHGTERGMLICWAGFTPGALDEARRFRHIALRDADAMLDAFLAQYERLLEDLRSRIPLKRILVLEEDGSHS